MKKQMIRGLKIAALIIPIMIVIMLLQKYIFVFQDTNTYRISRFYAEEENSLDVVFLGASEIHTGFSPGYAYGKYGFTSYMYSMDANMGSLYKAQLKEVLSHQDPQIIFVEAMGFLYNNTDQSNETRLRQFTENIPFSYNKIQTILEFPYKDKTSCFLPYIKYHNDWDLATVQISRLRSDADDTNAPSFLKGMHTLTYMYDGSGDDDTTVAGGAQIDALAKEYLIEFLEYCQQEELNNVIFVNMPRFIADEGNSKLLSRVKDVGEIVQQYGYEFLDLQEQKDDICVDDHTDFYNPHHLNIYGQTKVTEFLGSMIINEYQLTPRTQTEANKAHWEQCAEYAKDYAALADDAIRNGEELALVIEQDVLALIEERKSKQQ